MATYTSAQFDRLPKWAQQHIDRLARDLRHAKAAHDELRTTGPEGSPVVIERYDQPGLPLSPDETITYTLPSGRVMVTMSGGLNGRGTLQIAARDGALAVRPQSSNVVQISVTPL